MALNEVQKNIITKRKLILDQCSQDRLLQADFKRRCKDDFIYWCKYFAWTYDPRIKDTPHLPFVLYPFQEIGAIEIIEHIRLGKDLLIEKSRDMGLSWLVVMIFQWMWLFYEGSNFLVGSKKFENVDRKGEISTLFQKFRYNLNRQPFWLKPRGFNSKEHDNIGKIINPETSATFVGESANPDFSRSGRYLAILFDELAFWEYDYQAWTAAGDSSPCRIAVSTPYPFGKFADLAHDKDNKRIDVDGLLSKWMIKQAEERLSKCLDG